MRIASLARARMCVRVYMCYSQPLMHNLCKTPRGCAVYSCKDKPTSEKNKGGKGCADFNADPNFGSVIVTIELTHWVANVRP